MPKQMLKEPVSTDKKVVAHVETPVFEPMPVPPDFNFSALSPERQQAVIGFLDAADWHEANTKAGGGLPGTAGGRVTEGGAYTISLVTTQSGTNIKNLKRAEFKPPSRNALINRIMEETTALSETDEGIVELKRLRETYGPRAKEKGVKWLELYATEQADAKLAALKAQRDALGDAGSEDSSGSDEE